MKMFARLWMDDAGALITVEWLFVATIMVIGLVTGLKAIQSAILNEAEDFAGAVGALSQSYSFGGSSGCCSATNGSSFTDTINTYPTDTCTTSADAAGAPCSD